jgi:hypothetical protein
MLDSAGDHESMRQVSVTENKSFRAVERWLWRCDLKQASPIRHRFLRCVPFCQPSSSLTKSRPYEHLHKASLEVESITFSSRRSGSDQLWSSQIMVGPGQKGNTSSLPRWLSYESSLLSCGHHISREFLSIVSLLSLDVSFFIKPFEFWPK